MSMRSRALGGLVVLGCAAPAAAQAPATPPPATAPTADAAAPAASPEGAAPGLQISDELKELTWVGYQQLKDGARVFVRTNEPVRYHLAWRTPTVLAIELFNTQVMVKNHLRFLDTQFFDSPVLLVKTTVNEAVSPTTRVEITVRQKVPFQPKQEDNLIFIDFRR